MEKIIKIFIADDSFNVRKGLIAMLSRVEGIQITGQAQNVHEAIGSIQALKPDVVILDIKMPGGSGVDVLKYIKKEQPSTVVIILTNCPYPQYRQECMDKGANFFFDKSIELAKVIDVCRGLVQGSYGG
jgi:Response regulator containing a CheY-like receiver domain and an HTH DNA-binding domain